MVRSRVLSSLIFACCLVLVIGCDTGLREKDFTLVASNGIDDRINGYPWSMEMFDGDQDGTPEMYMETTVWKWSKTNGPPVGVGQGGHFGLLLRI